MRPLGCLLCLALAGCGERGAAEVKQWLLTVQQQTQLAAPQPLPRTPVLPVGQSVVSGVDPFNPDRLGLVKAAPSSAAYRFELARGKELLEGYPLERIKLVGTMQMAGVTWALLQLERMVYYVKVGQHVGQHFGLITSVNETSLTLREIVADASGAWIERSTQLSVQEAASRESKK